METTISKFEAGKTYYVRSIGDHNCIWRFRVVRRSASSVWVTGADDHDAAKVERRKISEYRGSENFSQFGRYSMSPTVYAENVADGANDLQDWEKPGYRDTLPAGKRCKVW